MLCAVYSATGRPNLRAAAFWQHDDHAARPLKIPDFQKSTMEKENLRRELESFPAHVGQVLRYVTTESLTRTSLIDPFLNRVGWPVAHPHRVAQEFPVPISGNADYALLDKAGRVIVIIEAKKAGAKIDDSLPPDQLKKYVHKIGTCNVGAWTNGLEWYWFCLDPTNTLGEAPFVTYDVQSKGWLRPSVLGWLASVRSQFSDPDPSRLLYDARTHEVTSKMQHWWESARKEPSDKLAQLVWKELGLSKTKASARDLIIVKRAWIRLHSATEPNGNGPVIIIPPPNGTNKPGPIGNPPTTFRQADGTILTQKGQKRAWRTRNKASGDWDEWKVESSGADVQARVAEWLIEWGGGLDSFKGGPGISLGPQPPDGKFKGYRAIFDGKAYVDTNKGNAAKERWLASLASNQEGLVPQPGTDFEVWLPSWIRKKD